MKTAYHITELLLPFVKDTRDKAIEQGASKEVIAQLNQIVEDTKKLEVRNEFDK